MIETIVSNMSMILAVMCAMCVLISVITEFTKEVGFLNKIPTLLQVLVLSLIVCVVVFLAALSHYKIDFVWYYLVAVVFASFIVALVTAKGWEYFIDIIKRYWRQDLK